MEYLRYSCNLHVAWMVTEVPVRSVGVEVFDFDVRIIVCCKLAFAHAYLIVQPVFESFDIVLVLHATRVKPLSAASSR